MAMPSGFLLHSDIDRVIEGDYCIGCGACAAQENSPYSMTWDKRLLYRAERKIRSPSASGRAIVCPFSSSAKNEDEIASELFSDVDRDEVIGRFDYLGAGHSLERSDRVDGSSGGLTTWLCRELLRLNWIDAVVHVKPAADNSARLFEYQISSSADDLSVGAKSRYYPVEVSGVIQTIRSSSLRYAFVGIPCMIKALRLLLEADPKLRPRIPFLIGIVCGHMKSGAFAEALAWESGTHPRYLSSVDFRTKIPGRRSSDYGATVTSNAGSSNTSIMRRSFVRDWGIGWFRPNACDYCDDVIAETADVSFGDAWIDKYENQWEGTNVVVVRRRELTRLLADAAGEGRIFLEPLTPQEVLQSQSSGFRHRREGLAYRLHLKNRKGEWAPKKRVQPACDLNMYRRIIYRLRMAIAKQSHWSFSIARTLNSFLSFKLQMLPLYAAYSVCGRLYRTTTLVRNSVRKLKIG